MKDSEKNTAIGYPAPTVEVPSYGPMPWVDQKLAELDATIAALTERVAALENWKWTVFEKGGMVTRGY